MNFGYWMQHPILFSRRVWHYFYERSHQTEPFLAPAAVRFLDTSLPREGIGLEWGSGRSTQWLAKRLNRLVAVEHDSSWYNQVLKQLKESALDNVDYRLIPLEHLSEEPTQPKYDPVPRYVGFVEEFPDSYFDFIEIDGHYRQACVLAALQKLKLGGFLLVDDTNWIPIEEWGVPKTWPIVHQSIKINTVTSIWKRTS
jgi:SAM-dependent methyltransferase